MWTRLIVILGGALLLAAVVSGVFLYGQNQTFDVPSFKHPRGDQILLPKDGRQDRHHVRVLKPDGVSPLRDTTYFANGETGVTIFGDNGALKFFVFYPGTDVNPYAADLPETGMKSFHELAAGGRMTQMEKHWDQEGRLKKLGVRLPDGKYVVEAYHGDGTNLAQKLTFAVKGEKLGEETYWENGQLKTLLVIDRSVFKNFTSYHADGKKAGFIKTEGNLESGEFYYEDGQTVSMSFKREQEWVYMAGYWVVNTRYFNRDGSLHHSRQFRLGLMRNDYPESGGNSAFHQEWKVIDEKRTTNQIAPDNYRLKSVKVARLFGHDDVLVEMSEDGKTVTKFSFTIKLADGKEELHRIELSADGNVSREFVKVGNSSQELEGKGRRFVVPEVYLRQHAYVPPPSVPLETYYPTWGY